MTQAQTQTEPKLYTFDDQMTPFKSNDLIVSATFPELNLTAQQVFDSVSY